MTMDATDPGLARALRAALTAQRPREGASALLRARVIEIPVLVRYEPAPVRLLRAFAVPLVVAGIATAAVVAAAFGLTRAPIDNLPPGGVGGVPAGLDPSISGLGLITGLIPTAIIGGTLLLALGSVLFAGTALSARPRTGGRLAAALLAVLVAASGIALLRPGVVLYGSTFVEDRFVEARLGFVESLFQGYNEVPRRYETAAPGEPTVFAFEIENLSAVPVRVEGLVMPGANEADPGHWTALWLPPSGQGAGDPGLGELGATSFAELRPFEPFTLEPGLGQAVYLVGRAGPCAFGPTFNPDLAYTEDELAGFAELGPTFTVAYSMFGLTNTAAIDIQKRFLEPLRAGCVTP